MNRLFKMLIRALSIYSRSSASTVLFEQCAYSLKYFSFAFTFSVPSLFPDLQHVRLPLSSDGVLPAGISQISALPIRSPSLLSACHFIRDFAATRRDSSRRTSQLVSYYALRPHALGMENSKYIEGNDSNWRARDCDFKASGALFRWTKDTHRSQKSIRIQDVDAVRARTWRVTDCRVTEEGETKWVTSLLPHISLTQTFTVKYACLR